MPRCPDAPCWTSVAATVITAGACWAPAPGGWSEPILTLRYVMQQRAVAKYLPDAPFDILPFTLETLVADGAVPVLPAGGFDTVFSMGVIYHRRDPEKHIRDLLKFLRPGGELRAGIAAQSSTGNPVICCNPATATPG